MKTKTEIEFLLKCFDAENKMTAQQIHNKMKVQINLEDRGFLFCHAKAETNGIVLSVEQINSWISGEVKRRENGRSDKALKKV
jgi:hypothetical protein